MLIDRDLIGEIKLFLQRKEFLAIVGPRQAGKTTLLELIKQELIKDKISEKNIKMATFEDKKLLIEFEEDPVGFVESYRSGNEKLFLMLDEFQYIKDGGQKLKLIYDTVKNIKIIVTGSSSLEIKAQVGKYMVGRILSFTLLPFSFGEFLKAGQDHRLFNIYDTIKDKVIKDWLPYRRGKDVYAESLKTKFEEYCVWGGYPAVVLAKKTPERKKILLDTFNNYVIKDVKTLLELTTDKNLILLSQHLATQIGNILVYKNLSNVADLDFEQTKRHLNLLAETFVADYLRPFFTNRNKELTKNPMVYFYDLGFRNILLENLNSLEKRVDTGAMVENMVWLALKRMLYNDLGKLNFWRTKQGAEVDFILSKTGEILPIEVKYANFDRPQITKSLASFIETYKCEKALVLTKDYFGEMKLNKNCRVIFVPVYYFC